MRASRAPIPASKGGLAVGGREQAWGWPSCSAEAAALAHLSTPAGLGGMRSVAENEQAGPWPPGSPGHPSLSPEAPPSLLIQERLGQDWAFLVAGDHWRTCESLLDLQLKEPPAVLWARDLQGLLGAATGRPPAPAVPWPFATHARGWQIVKFNLPPLLPALQGRSCLRRDHIAPGSGGSFCRRPFWLPGIRCLS